MPAPREIELAINEVHDQESFIQRLLVDTLAWPIPEVVTDVEDMSVEWLDEDLDAEGLTNEVLTGPVLQIQPLEDHLPSRGASLSLSLLTKPRLPQDAA